MRILIMGGAGFIGSHLCDYYLAAGHEVIAMDNLITGSLENIAHLRSNPSFSFIHHDVNQFIDVEGPLDAILHFASPASPVDYLRHPIPTLKVGALGTHNTLGIAKAKNSRYLLASTSEVYGDPEVHPQREDYWGNVNPIGIRSCYDEGKRVAETLLMDYHRQNKVDIRIIRIFNTYGPRMAENDGRVVSNFVLQALRNQDITVYGDGSQTRSFCYVDDLVEGMVRMMECDGFIGPVNLGNPVENTILEFAEKIIRITGASSRIINNPLPLDDPKQRQPDISLAVEKLGWKPSVDLESGLRRTVGYFAERLGKG